MRQTLIPAARCLTLLGFVVVLGPEAHAAITFRTLNNPGDPSFNQLLGINNSGTIAGYFGDGTIVPNNGYTVSPPYTSFTAENVPNSVQTQVTGLNNTGTTVGFFVDGAGDNVGFYKIGNSFVSVANPLSSGTPATNQLLGVNDSNVAAGFYVNGAGNSEGYLYHISGGTFTPVTLPSSDNAVSVVATGINNADDVSGFYTDPAGNAHGFLEVGSAFYSLDDPSGTNTMVFGLNNKDEAVGSYVDFAGVTQGFLYNWAANTWVTISDPLASANPAFGISGTTVNGINDLGQLVGFYSDGTNVNGMIATVTVPESGTWTMMVLGFAAFGVAGYRASRKGLATA